MLDCHPSKRLSKKIIIVILIKIFALTLLWWFCFSHPSTHQLTANRVEQHLL
jgi:Tfp pilus assembly protein PilO